MSSRNMRLMGILSSLIVSQEIAAFTTSPTATIGFQRRNDARRAFSAPSMVQVSSSPDKDIDSLNLTPQLESMTKAFGSIPDEKTRYKQ